MGDEMAMSYIIIAKVDGELHTITQEDVDAYAVTDMSLETVIEGILDERYAQSLRDAVKIEDSRDEQLRREGYEQGLRDGLSRAREEEFKRGDPGHPDNDMGM